MHSIPHAHLLEQLGSLYGIGTLSDRRAPFIYATLAAQVDDREGADRLVPTIHQGPERVPVADRPVIDTVLADPQDDDLVEITARGRFRVSADNT
jgi:hypothetical protein